MPKNVKLLLTESVEALGIVGDVVNVRIGYARNFLLPRNLATTPSDELVQQLAGKRADAERQLKLQRSHREEMIQKLQGVEIETTRSCNDQGILYGAITQQEIAKLLGEKGFGVKPRDVRIHEVVKRVGNYDVHVKLDADLDATVKLKVKPDRELESETGEPVAAAAGGGSRRADLIAEAAKADAEAKAGSWGSAKKSDKHADAADAKPAKGDRPDKKPAKGEPKGESKPEKADKPAKQDKGADKKGADKKGEDKKPKK